MLQQGLMITYNKRQTFTSASRGMWNTHNRYMGFIQDKSWCCLQGALTNWKAQQQAAGQWKSLGLLTGHPQVSHREGALVEVAVRVWKTKTMVRTAWTESWKQEVYLNLEIFQPFIYWHINMGKTILVATTDLIISRKCAAQSNRQTTVMFAFNQGNTKLACPIQQPNMNAFTFTTVLGLHR